MSDAPHLQTLAAALNGLMRWLAGESIQGAVIGGVAASIHGRPRLTHDVDAVILADEIGWEKVLASAAGYGIQPRIEDPLGFAHRSRVLLLRHVSSGVDLDVSLGALPFEHEIVARSFRVDVGPVHVQLVTAEDLVVMKALARRPRDFADIESIIDMHPDLDLDRIRRWLREFSSVLEIRRFVETQRL
jgi:hypothetical protein